MSRDRACTHTWITCYSRAREYARDKRNNDLYADVPGTKRGNKNIPARETIIIYIYTYRSGARGVLCSSGGEKFENTKDLSTWIFRKPPGKHTFAFDVYAVSIFFFFVFIICFYYIHLFFFSKRIALFVSPGSYITRHICFSPEVFTAAGQNNTPRPLSRCLLPRPRDLLVKTIMPALNRAAPPASLHLYCL